MISVERMAKEHIGLAWSFHVSPFSCDNPNHYEEFLKYCAIEEYKSGRSVTHVLLNEEENRIIGFVALRVTSLMTEGNDGKPEAYPTLEISELAIDKDYEHQGYGSLLFSISLEYARHIRENIAGIRYIALCADHKAVGFYEKLGLTKLRDYLEIPRDGWNNNCEPMYIELPKL